MTHNYQGIFKKQKRNNSQNVLYFALTWKMIVIVSSLLPQITG